MPSSVIRHFHYDPTDRRLDIVLQTSTPISAIATPSPVSGSRDQRESLTNLFVLRRMEACVNLLLTG